MKITKRKNISIAEAIAYTKIELPSITKFDTESLKSFWNKIVFQIQGESAEIEDKYSLPLLMISFDAIHKFSPEMVLKLQNGERFLIFDHQVMSVFRPDDVITEFSNNKKDETIQSKQYVPELCLNIEDIFNKISESDFKIRIKKSLEKIKNKIAPAEITTLIGKEPSLLFLLVQHLLYGKTGEIWYQEKETSTPIKIFF